MLAPRTDDRIPPPTPVPATTPNRRHTTSTVRSDKAPIPKARSQPTSIRNKAPKPSCRRDTAPNHPARSEPKLDRNPARSAIGRSRPDLPPNVIFVRMRHASALWIMRSRSLFHRSQSSRSGAALTLYCASAPEPRTVAISPCLRSAMPCGVEICASPFAHDHDAVAIGPHFNAEHAILCAGCTATFGVSISGSASLSPNTE
jgi:hypothetical protein